MKAYDFIIAGAGITGLVLAWQIRKKFTDSSILILEKESGTGFHSSGRNSGVLHSGIYYKEDSLKAKFCASGSAQMKAFCQENDLPLDPMGKVIVPTKEEDDHLVDLLAKRAKSNGARVSIIDSNQLREIEPFVRTASGRALHSPDTAVIDPKAVLVKLIDLLKSKNVDIAFGESIQKINPSAKSISTSAGQYEYGYFCNCAGAYADKLAQPFGLAENFTMLPFKGLYYKLDPQSAIKLKGLVYPVPDMNVPFLGVHTVKSIDGTNYFGPTAVPAFGRENYRGLQGIQVTEMLGIFGNVLRQYLANNQGFRNYAHAEAFRYFKSRFTEAAKVLIPELKSKDLLSCQKVGIRGQLLDKEKKEMVMDFLVEKAGSSIHVLNVVSPGFTSAFSFSDHILSLILEEKSREG
ncbi:MAG: L-2-hydroxyglutarate oxidase [Lentisphaeraceae bacterium]|nr:L-2-hydroxyglutarate oxidase [Lentisphaeraceae bacterium]